MHDEACVVFADRWLDGHRLEDHLPVALGLVLLLRRALHVGENS